MKVLHVGKYYPPHYGGMETAVRDMCETVLSEVDVEVIAANSHPHRSEEILAGVRVTRLANLRTVMSQPVVPSLFGELRRRRADVVHLHAPNPLAMACFLLSRNPARLIVHYHSDIVRQRVLGRLLLPLVEAVLDRAEAIVVGSQELRDTSPVLAARKSKCVVIPFGISLARLLAIHRPPAFRRQATVLAVGRLSYYKGFQHLIQAACHVDAHFVIAGEGEMRPELAALIKRLGLESRVRLAGRVSDGELFALYRESDVFCFPSCETSEAFGLAMVEALAAGLPVVSTDLPTGVRFVNQHGATGWVVPSADPAALSAALADLIADPARRQQFGAAGRERARRLFAREAMGEALVRLYRKADNTNVSQEAVHA